MPQYRSMNLLMASSAACHGPYACHCIIHSTPHPLPFARYACLHHLHNHTLKISANQQSRPVTHQLSWQFVFRGRPDLLCDQTLSRNHNKVGNS